MDRPSHLITDQRNVFLNTDTCLNPDSTGGDIKLTFNDVNINCNEDSFFKLILKQFNCYKSWSNINENNNSFTLNDGNSNIVGSLTPKKYLSINDIVSEFADKVNQLLINAEHYTTGTIVINNPTGSDLFDNTDNIMDFTINTTTAHGFSNDDIKCYANILQGDIYSLFGLKRSKIGNTINGLIMTAPTTTSLNFKGFYNCQLSTESYVYLNCSIVNCCIATRNYSAGLADTPGSQLKHTTILAKIPIQKNVLAYDTQSDEYFAMLKNMRNISYMELYLTDSKGRQIPLINPNQDTLGNCSFECVVEIQTIQRLGNHRNHFTTKEEESKSYSSKNTQPLVFHKHGKIGY